MRRGIVLGAIVAVGSASLTVAALQQPAPALEIEALKDNLFVIRGGGGASAVFVRSDGVALVDTKVPGLGAALVDKIGEVTSKPITTIINTHTHFDHVGSNPHFPAAVEVVAHERTAALMQEMNAVTGLSLPARENIFEASGGRGLATRTFTDRMTLGAGADRIDLHHFGRGHTGGDAWVVFPALRVMHAGDMFPGKALPIMDANNGGSGVDFSATLARAHAAVTGIDTIITGHSTTMTPDDLLEYSEFVGDFVAAVRAGKQAGRSAEAIAESWTVPSQYAEYADPQPERLRAYVEVVYDELD